MSKTTLTSKKYYFGGEIISPLPQRDFKFRWKVDWDSCGIFTWFDDVTSWFADLEFVSWYVVFFLFLSDFIEWRMALPFQFEPEFAEDQMSDISNCSEEEESEGRQTDRRSFFVDPFRIVLLISLVNHGRLGTHTLLDSSGSFLSIIVLSVDLNSIQASSTVNEVLPFSQEAICKSSRNLSVE